MALSTGTRLGPYEVLTPIGAGGMGEVYRGTDTKLNRTVAIKALRVPVAGDPDRVARFEREAQLLASLNHPNIAAIHGLQEQDGATYLILEFIDGKALNDVLRESGALPATEALPIARQIADAIAAAHEKGIIHRDLKPGNVMVTADGKVKVLDFGLGKSIENETASSASQSDSPTMTLGGTQAGIILGTAGYMSPEQAKGRTADRRSDVWSFGCLLFELLANSRAFDGDDVTETIAAIVRGEPNWKALPASTPPALKNLLERCLVKDRNERLADMSVVRYVLSQPGISDVAAQREAPGRSSGSRLWIASTAALAATAFGLGYLYFTRGSAVPAEPLRFTVPYPATAKPMSNGADNHGGSLSPNGQFIAFSAADTRTEQVGIYLRRFDGLDATMIPGTEDGRYPFWSPDSRTIAFYALGKLMRINIDGTAPQVICDAPTGGWGGAWTKDDVIVAGISDPGPLHRVSAKGGAATPVTKVLPGELDHDWPYLLPDGKHFVYTAWSDAISSFAAIYVGSLDATDGTLVTKDTNQAAAFAGPHHLLVIRNNALIAQEIDLQTFSLRGEPQAIATNAREPITASATGTIGYTTTATDLRTRLAWINLDGTQERPIADARYYGELSLSPDGTKIAFSRSDSATGTEDIWIRDATSGAEQKLTFDPANDISPIWSPAGDELIFRSDRSPSGLYRKRANGAGEEKLVSGTETGKGHMSPYQWRVNDTVIGYGGLPSTDILEFSLTSSKTTPLVTSRSITEQRGAVSPDGKWLAYDSRATARFEVYLTTYPPSAGSKWMVTTTGGAEPQWGRDGKRLFYVSSATGALMVVDVIPGDPPRFTSPRIVHPGPLDWGFASSHTYDLDRTTGRALVRIQSGVGQLTVLVNWQSLLK